MTLLTCVEAVLNRGLDDWVQAFEIAYVAKSVGGATTENETRELSIEIVREVTQEGLMKVGEVTWEGFREWNLNPYKALERIEREWAALGRDPGIGEIFWLSNTDKGDKRARDSQGQDP